MRTVGNSDGEKCGRNAGGGATGRDSDPEGRRGDLVVVGVLGGSRSELWRIVLLSLQRLREPGSEGLT